MSWQTLNSLMHTLLLPFVTSKRQGMTVNLELKNMKDFPHIFWGQLRYTLGMCPRNTDDPEWGRQNQARWNPPDHLIAFSILSENSAGSVKLLHSSNTIPQVLATGSLAATLSTNVISGLWGKPKGGCLAAPVQNCSIFSKVTPVRPAENIWQYL